MNVDKMTSGFWSDVAVGDVIQLKDEQALKDSLERGRGFNPIEYIVGEIRSLREADGLCSWTMYRLDDPGQQTLWLLRKVVDDLMDLRTYYTPDESYSPTLRDDLIAQGASFLFDTTVPDVPLHDALFAPVIAYTLPDVGEINFVRKNTTLTAVMRITPAPSGVIQPVMTMVTEYVTEQQYENPELLILEIGDDDAGGMVHLFLGSNLGETDFDVLKR